MGNSILDIVKKPSLLFMTLGHRGFFNWMNDERYIKIAYRIKTGKRLDLENPKTFNEKLQWLKIHDRKPEYTAMVDKYEAKKYVANIIGDEYIIPTLGVWDSFDEIDFESLPEQFVLKCTHDSGGLVIVRDKSTFNKKIAKKKIEKSLRTNYFYGGREWPYKNVRPRIIAEKYMDDSESSDNYAGQNKKPNEFQFWCFYGIPEFVSAIFQPHGDNLKCTYNREWKRLPFVTSLPIYDKDLEKPIEFEKMLESASKLSEGIPFLRVDFLVFNSKVYFGELTKYPAEGMVKWHPSIWDERIGGLIDLNKMEAK